MDCYYFSLPGQHDIDNLDILYKNPPTQVNDFEVVDVYVSGGQANVVFQWTDRSYNEKFQYVARDGYPYPLDAGRDAETIEWTALELDTYYCFYMVPVNAYGVQADPSDQTCVWTPPDLSGVYDVLVGNESLTLFHCIARLDHDVDSNQLTSAQQCHNDLPGLGETSDMPPPWAVVACVEPDCPDPDLQVPGETGRDAVPGPPLPPPYAARPPDEGSATFYPQGDDCQNVLGSLGQGDDDPCVIHSFCMEDIGPPSGIGPNLIFKAYIGDPADIGAGGQVADDGKSLGKVDVWYNQSNAACAATSPVGSPDFQVIPFTSYLAYDAGLNPGSGIASWRNTSCGTPPCNPNPGWTVLDYDGDGCRDWYELAESPPSGCGDDPQNPFDSFNPNTVDLTGPYDINMRLVRGDVGAPGEYFNCRSYLTHNGDDSLSLPLYCYYDEAGAVINPEAFPGITGDGYFGAPPPGPEALTTCPVTCREDPGSGNYVWGDVDTAHAELTGMLTPATATITLSGCIPDEDGFAPLGNVWVVAGIPAHQLPGLVNIYPFQPPDCDGSPTGSPLGGQIDMAKQPGGAARDSDQDGVPDHRELGDDIVCGRRDPFNINDYYDVSIPRDGAITLFGDILLVIGNFNATGYAPGTAASAGPGTMENYDRPAPLAGAGGGWNRGSPNYKIDLFVDVLGVIGQFKPGGCPG